MKRPLVIIHGQHRIEADRIECKGDGVIVAKLSRGETVAVISPGASEWAVESKEVSASRDLSGLLLTPKQMADVKPALVSLLNALEGRQVVTTRTSMPALILAVRSFMQRANEERIAKLDERIAALSPR